MDSTKPCGSCPQRAQFPNLPEACCSAPTDTPQCPCLEGLPRHVWMHLPGPHIHREPRHSHLQTKSWSQDKHTPSCSSLWTIGSREHTQPLDRGLDSLFLTTVDRRTRGELASLLPGFLVCIMKLILELLRNTQGSGQHSAPTPRLAWQVLAGCLTLSVALMEHKCATCMCDHKLHGII